MTPKEENKKRDKYGTLFIKANESSIIIIII
jgi:hypothetical protein